MRERLKSVFKALKDKGLKKNERWDSWMKATITKTWGELSDSLGFAKDWIEVFLAGEFFIANYALNYNQRNPTGNTIMDTMLIQLTHRKAAGLLHELEELHIIRVLRKNIRAEQGLSKKYAGKLPPAIADELQNHVDQGRQEWNQHTI